VANTFASQNLTNIIGEKAYAVLSSIIFEVSTSSPLITMARVLEEGPCYVALTHDHLDVKSIMDRVRSPKAGAIVIFAGDTAHVALHLLELTAFRYYSRQL
jgi:hypothetical protein